MCRCYRWKEYSSIELCLAYRSHMDALQELDCINWLEGLWLLVGEYNAFIFILANLVLFSCLGLFSCFGLCVLFLSFLPFVICTVIYLFLFSVSWKEYSLLFHSVDTFKMVKKTKHKNFLNPCFFNYQIQDKSIILPPYKIKWGEFSSSLFKAQVIICLFKNCVGILFS